MANLILDGVRLSDFHNSEARKAVLRVNRKVAQRLGINLRGVENY